jgi:hypothetical protein
MVYCNGTFSRKSQICGRLYCGLSLCCLCIALPVLVSRPGEQKPRLQQICINEAPCDASMRHSVFCRTRGCVCETLARPAFACIHTHSLLRTHTYTKTHTHTNTSAHTQVQAHTRTQIHTNTNMHKYRRTCIHTRTHTLYTHAHTHWHTQELQQWVAAEISAPQAVPSSGSASSSSAGCENPEPAPDAAAKALPSSVVDFLLDVGHWFWLAGCTSRVLVEVGKEGTKFGSAGGEGVEVSGTRMVEVTEGNEVSKGEGATAAAAAQGSVATHTSPDTQSGCEHAELQEGLCMDLWEFAVLCSMPRLAALLRCACV